jgi:hypothetical protein
LIIYQIDPDFGRAGSTGAPRSRERFVADDPQITTMSRKKAASGKVDYSTVVLHETSRRRVVLVPYYIPRSAGTDVAVKIQTYTKDDPPFGWVLSDDKSVTLDGAATRRLLGELRKALAVGDQSDEGDFLLIPVNKGTADISQHEPEKVAQALTNVLSQSEVVEHLANVNLADELVLAFRGALRLAEMRNAVAELRQHLDGGATSEGTYQAWCEKHSWAFGNAYVVRDELRDISAGDSLDLLLPSVISGYRDLVELKRPDATVLLHDSSHRNFYFSAEVSRAIGQCHRYLDVLHEAAAHGLRDHPEIVAYHPRAIVVIGRSGDWDQQKLRALHGLNSRLSKITIMTYDQLLAQGERLVEILTAKTAAAAECETYDEVDSEGANWTDDEDIPF